MSGLIFILSRLPACEELLGYPSRSHPFSITSFCDNRETTICHRSDQLEVTGMTFRECNMLAVYHTSVTISSGTSMPVSMYSFAFFPISVPDDTSARKRSPVEMCTKPYWNMDNMKKEMS